VQQSGGRNAKSRNGAAGGVNAERRQAGRTNGKRQEVNGAAAERSRKRQRQVKVAGR